MKSVRWKEITAIALIFISVMIYSNLIVHVNELQRFERCIIVEMAEERNFQKDITSDSDMLLTGKGRETIVGEIYLGKEVSGNVRYAYGNLHILLPDIYNVNLGEMKNRCVISSSVSHKLFGTDESVGMRIKCEGKEYVIAGVTKSKLYTENEIILSSVENEDSFYDRAGYIRDDKMTVKMAEQYLQNQYGINGKIMDIHSILMIMKVFLVLYFVAIGTFILVLLRKVADKKEKTICTIAVLVTLLYITMRQFGFSIEEFPGQWSDYEAWGNYFRQRADSVKTFIDMRNQCMCGEITKSFFKILGGLCIAIPCLINRWTMKLLE